MLKRNSCYVWLGPELGMAPCDLAQGCVGHLRWPQAACHGPARAAMGRPREAAPCCAPFAVSSPDWACGVQVISMEILKPQRHLATSDGKRTPGLAEGRSVFPGL